jgi:hypothetical protein
MAAGAEARATDRRMLAAAEGQAGEVAAVGEEHLRFRHRRVGERR